MGPAMKLGPLMSAYDRLKGPILSEAWRKAARMRAGLFLAVWGADQLVEDISQVHVDKFTRERMSGALAPDRGARDMAGVRAGTVDGDFRWLSSVFNWARKHKQDGRRLIRDNPLHDVRWPKEQNPRRPVASHDRYLQTLARTDTVDPTGRLRCILALARYTGRREGAICALKAADVLQTPDQVRAAIAEAGMDERLAEHMPHGAIRWDSESDKMGLLFVSPLSGPARKELDHYLRGSPRVGEAAKLPKLRGGVLHPYRRLFASERKHLPDVDVAAAGGWKDTRALKLSYQQADPASVLRVVEHGA